MTTGKTIALTRWTFVGKVMSLLLNMLSRLMVREAVHVWAGEQGVYRNSLDFLLNFSVNLKLLWKESYDQPR